MDCIICRELAEDTFNGIPYCFSCWTIMEEENLEGSVRELRKKIKAIRTKEEIIESLS